MKFLSKKKDWGKMRARHCLGVARLMYNKCLELGKTEEYAREMYTLGYLHDFAYEFDCKAHDSVGGCIMKNMGYKYYNEIINHGLTSCEYSSFELDLLNWADLQVTANGKRVTFRKRLKDISKRHPMNSEEYQNTLKLVDEIDKKIK